MISVSSLTKRFGGTVAVDNISFDVKKGEIVGFLGPNGAGKTTTMRVLAGFFPATGGTVTIAGFDVFRDSLEVRRKIGYLPENVPLYGEMRVVEYLSYRARLKGLRGKRLRSRLDNVIDACGLGDVKRTVIGRLSKGYKQRIGLADSLVHEPDLLILDEPTIGLDPNQIRQIRTLIRGLASRHTVLLSSHILPEVEMICERVLIISRGRIVASDTTESLLGLMKGNRRAVVEVKGERDRIQEKLQQARGVVRVTWEAAGEWHRFACECQGQPDICPALFRVVSENGWELRELTEQKRNLEDVFVALTGEQPEIERP